MSKKSDNKNLPRTICVNRKARFDYFLEQEFETGIVLLGTEVKSIRNGGCSVTESYAGVKDGEIWLYGMHVPEYQPAGKFNHNPTRNRKLLLHKTEIKKIIGKTSTPGTTIAVLSVYISERNLIKVKIAIAKGKKEFDKRETIKKRDLEREDRRKYKI